MLNTKIYKPCETKCGKCRPCKEFQKVVSTIDLKRVSKREIELKNRGVFK